MPSPPRQFFLPPRRRWSRWAIGLSVGLHLLLLLVQVKPWLKGYSTRLPALIVLLPPGSEGSRAVELRFQEPGGAARKGRAAGITPRPEEAAPNPEPAKLEPQPPVTDTTPVVIAAPAPPTALAPCDTCGPRLYRIGPALGEGKLWVRPLPAPPRELAEAITRTHFQLVDSAVSAIVQQYIDSVLSAPAAPGAAPPSWTTQIFGKTFGIDSKYIYLGGLKIPSALLALLPIKAGGTTMEYSQSARLSAIREDLASAAQRAQTMEDFKRAIRELRAERERLHQIEANQKKKPEKKDSVTKKP